MKFCLVMLHSVLNHPLKSEIPNTQYFPTMYYYYYYYYILLLTTYHETMYYTYYSLLLREQVNNMYMMSRDYLDGFIT